MAPMSYACKREQTTLSLSSTRSSVRSAMRGCTSKKRARPSGLGDIDGCALFFKVSSSSSRRSMSCLARLH